MHCAAGGVRAIVLGRPVDGPEEYVGQLPASRDRCDRVLPHGVHAEQSHGR